MSNLALIGMALFAFPVPKGAEPDTLTKLQQTLHGVWNGPACGGVITIKDDGTYSHDKYTPGNISLSGTWTIKWDGKSPALLLSCTVSDDEDRVGKTTEWKLNKLNAETLTLEIADYKRVKK